MLNEQIYQMATTKEYDVSLSYNLREICSSWCNA